MPRFIFQVQVRCLTPREGGRQTHLGDRYRAICRWGSEKEACSVGQLIFQAPPLGKRENPWGMRQATLELFVEDTSLRRHFSFIMKEGAKVTAHGKVLGQIRFEETP